MLSVRVSLGVLALLAACTKREAQPVPVPGDAASDAAVDAPAIVVDAPAAPRLTVTRVVAGADSTCAIMSNRTLRCWGRNDHGQLGDGTTADAATPVALELRGVMDVQLAGSTACALLDDSSVACWGHIAWLGTKPETLRPTGVLGVKGVKQLFVLDRRACGRVANDSLVCWGGIAPGARFTTQGLDQRHYPTPSSELVAIAELAATAARADDGTVWMWDVAEGTPTKTELAGERELAARAGTVCARQETGVTSCAGERLACLPAVAPSRPTRGKPAKPAKPAKKPARPTRPAPKPPEPAVTTIFPLVLPKARQLVLEAGWCVVTQAGTVQCGDGCGRLEPPWRGLDKVTELRGFCARRSDGTVACWPREGARTVTRVAGITKATALAVGRAHACALVGAAVSCWGDNQYGQLGRGDLTAHDGAAAILE